MKQETMLILADEMANAIAKHVEDPRKWAHEARRAADALGLNVIHLRFFETSLYEICIDVVDAAVVRGKRTEQQIRDAIVEIETRDRS